MAGQRIDPTEISEKFGVSKTPITQALKRMGNEGLLSCTKGGKYYVPYCKEQDVREVCYVRLLFEQEAVKYLLKTVLMNRYRFWKRVLWHVRIL